MTTAEHCHQMPVVLELKIHSVLFIIIWIKYFNNDIMNVPEKCKPTNISANLLLFFKK